MLKKILFALITFCTVSSMYFAHATVALAQGTPSSVFGTIEKPKGVKEFNDQTGNPDGIGVIIFASNMIKIITIVAGIIVFINFIMAGYNFITSDGNASANEKVRNQITMSVIGLALIVMSYTIIAVLSFIIFGDSSYILDPQIPGPKTTITAPAGP